MLVFLKQDLIYLYWAESAYMSFLKKLVLNTDHYLKQKYKYLIQKKLLAWDRQKKMHNKMLHLNF